MKSTYREYVDKGREFARSMRPNGHGESVHSVAETLEKLTLLREAGSLTQEEFDELKGRLLGNDR